MAIRWKNPLPTRARRWAALAWRKSPFYSPKPSKRTLRKAEESQARLRAFSARVNKDLEVLVQEETAKAMEMRKNVPEEMIFHFLGVNPRGETSHLELISPAFATLPENHPAKVNHREMVKIRERIIEQKKLANKDFLNEKSEIFEELLPIVVRRTMTEIGVRDPNKRKGVIEAMRTLNSWATHSVQNRTALPNGIPNRTIETIDRLLGKNAAPFMRIYGRVMSRMLERVMNYA